MLYDTYNSYKAAFCFAAVPEIIGALMLFLIPYYRRNQVKYTEYYSNSGILGNGNAVASTLNPISEADEPRGEYNVVISLTSDSPDVRLVNVVIHKAGGGEATGVTCNDDETDKNKITQIQDNGIVNKAVEETEIPVCSREMPVCASTLANEATSPVEQPSYEASVSGNEAEPNILSVLSPIKTCSTDRVKHDFVVEAIYTDNSTKTVNEDQILPLTVLTSQTSATTLSQENKSEVVNVEISAPVETLVAIVSNESDAGSRQNYETPGIINLGLQVKTSNKSLLSEGTPSVIRIASNIMHSGDGLESLGEEIIHLQTEEDVPKISPPPQHKHHVKTDGHHVANADVSIGCHEKVVDGSPEAMLAELDSLVQGNELSTNPCLATPFNPDATNQQASLMKCSGLESGITGFTTESGLNNNQESLMLSATLIPEMASSCLSTAFSTEPSHMSGINDVLTHKQLPEPLKPTSFSSVKGNEQHSVQTPDVPAATSPLSCELSTVIADVIQSLTSQQSASQKSTKDSTVSSTMADSSQGNSTDLPEKKRVHVTGNTAAKEPKSGVHVEPSSQANSELSSFCKLQTSVLHSMQSIVAEGCPEDVALLEDISIDLTLDKDPSFASIVLIDDADEEKDTTDLNVISGQTQPDLARQPPVVSHEPICAKQSNANQMKIGSTLCQEQNMEPNFNLTYEQAITSSFVSSQLPNEPTTIDASTVKEKHFTAPTQEHDISPSAVISNQLQHDQAHELTKKHSSVISTQEVQFPNVVQEPVVAYTILGNTQKQPFTSLESTTTYANASSTDEQNALLLNQELIIAKPSCTTDLIYQDGVALELFSEPNVKTATICEGIKSHEKLTVPIESSNPFYQDLSK